jgi:hypothetical protein
VRYSAGSPLSVTPDVWYPGWAAWGGGVYADVEADADLKVIFEPETFNPGAPPDPGNRYFDPSNFSDPRDHKLGNGKMRYEELCGFGFASEDIGIMKYWSVGERVRLQFRCELLNAFNRHRFEDPITHLGAGPVFGNVTEKGGKPRSIQLGFRLTW